jgi:beta-glucosidase/6-phospho-beta-glucosidase/beta-galactosidase
VHVPSVFDSFFMAGFECSTQRWRNGRRLDLLAATAHDRLAAQDYRQVAELGLRTARDGLRWHLIEQASGHYDWSSFLPMLRAARTEGVQVIWDLCHYGWPPEINSWGSKFVDAFARFATASARIVREETDTVPFFSIINEISYWAWAGNCGLFHPLSRGRGNKIKRQLVRAAIAGIEAVRAVEPRARFVQVDPIINVVGGGYNELQFAAWDMLTGRLEPELGGKPEYLDLVGVNYYCDNQWRHRGSTIPLGHHLYKPLSDLLAEVHARYARPMVLAETGAEGSGRAAWLFYVADEIRTALATGVPMEGVCLYPVLDYPGWDDDRHCAVGLFGNADSVGRRLLHAPFAEELKRQQSILAEILKRRRLARGLVEAAA